MAGALTTGTFVDNDDAYQKIRTALLGVGWTIHDTLNDVVGTRQQVFRSPELDAGVGNYTYIRIYHTGTTFGWSTYTDWDTGTNLGQHQIGNSTYSSWDITGRPYILRVNEFSYALCIDFGSYMWKHYLGLVRRGLRPEKAGRGALSVAATVGASSVTVGQDLTSSLNPGQKVIIYNHGHSSASPNWGNLEMQTVQSVTATTVTFVGTLSNSYDIGAVIGENPLPNVFMYPNTSNTTIFWSGYQQYYHTTGQYFGTTSQSGRSGYVFTTYETYTDPEIGGAWGGGVVDWQITSTSYAGEFGYMYHWEVTSSNTSYWTSLNDIFDDTVDQFYVIMSGYSTCVAIMGPI